MSSRIRIIKGLNLVGRGLKNPGKVVNGIKKSLNDDRKNYVIKKYGLKKGLPFVDILNLLPNLNESVEPYSFLSHGSYPIDLALLVGIAKKFENCRYLEIGTWRGESVANVARVAKECVSIGLSDNELKAFGHNNSYIKIQKHFSKNLKNVTHIEHNSHTFNYSNFKEGFDLIFVDGDHSYKGVMIDTKNVFKLLRKKDSIIIWHDGGTNFENNRWSVLAGILDGCPKDKLKNLYRVSNTLCTIYYPGKIKSYFPDYPSIPNKSFKLQISARMANKD
jgi:hypothetical protein